LLLGLSLVWGWWWQGRWHDEWLRGVPRSTVFRDRDGTLLQARLGEDERWRFPVPLVAVSPTASSSRDCEGGTAHADENQRDATRSLL